MFIGRAWLAEAVRRWAASDVRYLFLTGQPGTGKSAAVDHLWGGEPIPGLASGAVYQCRANYRRTCDPVRFAEALAEQFSRTLPGFADALMQVSTELSGRSGEVHIEGSASATTVHPEGSVIGVRVSISNVSADEAFDRLVARPLERVTLHTKPIVVIDALDEALTYRGHRTIAELVLEAGADLPLRFVITSRHDARIIATMEVLEGVSSLDLVGDAPDADADLVEFALHRLRDLVGDAGERAELARKLAANGAGNYLYVHHLTAELTAGTRDLAELDDLALLPRGLEDLYQQFLRREIRPLANAAAEDRWREQFRPALSLLTSAQEGGFSVGQLAEILGSTEQSVMDVVRVLGQYLVGRPRGPWTLYHRSFADFLLHGPDPHLDAAEGHQRIVDYGFEQWAGHWEACDDAYYLRHLPDHVMTALEYPNLTRAQTRTLRDRLYALATSKEYLAAQSVSAPAREPHLATIGLALDSSLGSREYERVVLLALALVDAQSAADSLTPVQAALDWGVEAGVAKARTYPEEISLLWHLLIMAALGLQGRREALAVPNIVKRSGFDTVNQEWSSAAAALVAPFVPVLGSDDRLGAVLRIADDAMLGYLAMFLLEGVAPDWSIVPALLVEEGVVRARAITEILSRAALAEENTEELPALGDLVMEDYARRQGQINRMLGRDGEEAAPLKTYLLTPDVPDSVLVAQAVRGEFQEACRELTDSDGIYHHLTGADAVLLGMIVDAVLHGGEAADRARDAGEEALRQQPGHVWSILHYTTYLRGLGDPRAAELLDRIVGLSHTNDDDDWYWEMYRGHIDPFHGRCDVGLKFAVIRELCAAGRTVAARAEAEYLREGNPAEFIRALSYVRNAGPDEDTAQEALESARHAAAATPDNLHSQAMLVLADGDLARLIDTMAKSLVRVDSAPLRGITAWSSLAWAARLRGDQERAAALGRLACEQFVRLPEEYRLPRTRDRIVRNLLRARQSGAAATVLNTPTTHRGSRVLLPLDDVEHDLIMSGEVEELKLLRSAVGRIPDPADGESLQSQARLMSFLRANGDFEALAGLRSATRTRLEDAMERMTQEIGREQHQYFDSDSDETEAARLALLAADLGEPEKAETAVSLMNSWAYKAEMRSDGWDAFRGHFPRSDETRQDSDNRYSRRSHVAAHLAEAYHRSGDPARASATFSEARKLATVVRTASSRSLAFSRLTEFAARCGWYAELRAIWPEATRARDSWLGAAPEMLVVTIQQGGAPAADAREAFDVILRTSSLTNLDHLDLLSLVAVLSPESDVEARLLAAFPAR
ncbi:hypothetical protein ACFZBU_41995 [Embleya sp. NPDC008237]|uniref:hypothetical protein n=1 Tax=Embleya sp. NPDC008237 TaxID=3363978 RepID=UPI0036EA76BB